ncbi:hypothetical protein [Tropicimonas sp. S265A]|uniref:hypothetical protein n=1 Tax=Tropicimonas sp. S265A TaxID=3415134 RepID=UPI003C7A9413
MSNAHRTSPIEGLKGSEQHHDLKDQPGENGDPTHADTDGELPEDIAAAIRDGEADTEIAAAMKDAVEKD